MEPKFKLMDCTFRDGGYYNDWFFEKEMVEETLAVFNKLPIECVEIGFRKYDDEVSLGAHLYTKEEYINKLKIPKNQSLALMCTLGLFEGLSDEQIQKDFVPKAESKVDIIRVAAPSGDIDHAIIICKLIMELGYKVCLNIMHISAPSKEQMKEVLKKLKGETFHVVCFADTMGNIMPHEFGEIIDNTRLYYDGELGCHTHDNRGFAMMNTLHVLEKGATWVDASLSGMGRGSGNLLLESFLIEMDHKYQMNLDLTGLFDLNEKYFWPMKEKYGWGYNPYYHLGSVVKTHPFKIQNLLSDKSISVAEKIDFIKKGGSR